MMLDYTTKTEERELLNKLRAPIVPVAAKVKVKRGRKPIPVDKELMIQRLKVARAEIDKEIKDLQCPKLNFQVYKNYAPLLISHLKCILV